MAARDPNFLPKAIEISARQLHPPTAGPTFWVDELSGLGIREPAAPSQDA